MHRPSKKPQLNDEIRTRPTLLSRLRSNTDGEAWLRFYEMYQGVILGMSRMWGLSEATSRDVLQEVMLAVNRMSKTFSYDRDKRVFIANPDRLESTPGKKHGGFRQWLFVVTKRAIWKHRYSATSEREVLFSDLSNDSGDGGRDLIEQIKDDDASPDTIVDEESERNYSMALFEEAVRLLPQCTKRSHPRKLALFLALKLQKVFDTTLAARSSPLPYEHTMEMKALARLPRDASGCITKPAIMAHYKMSSNHVDKEVQAIKNKLAEIFADLRAGRDPRDS
jgi:DNA-directed RNA polymerase specialized sigma24 family protein